MPKNDEYIAHAEECFRLANATADDCVKRELLNLRQTFLKSAERLRLLSEPHSGRS